MPRAPGSGSVRINGCDIPFSVAGDGPPVVCSELPLNPAVRFARLQQSLASCRRVYIVDLRSLVGRPSAPAPDLLDFLAAKLVDVFDALSLESVTVIGSFMFGGVAMEAARLAPSRVNRLVLIGSLGLVRLPRTWLMRGITGFYRLPGIPLLLRSRVIRTGVEWGDRIALVPFRKRQLFYNPRGVAVRTEDLYEHYKRPPVDAAGWALVWCIRNLRYDALVAQLARVDRPTLIVHGAEDLWVPPRYAEELQALLPRAQLAWIPRARHMPELEHPEQTYRIIDGFLGAPGPVAFAP